MPKIRKIALVIKPRISENASLISSIARYNRLHERWSAFIDDQGVSLEDPEWLFTREWDGVITRHWSEKLVNACLEREVPCVNLSDTQHCREGVPKIHQDHAAVGHLGAEHFMEKGYENFAFASFEGESWSEKKLGGFREALELADRKCLIYESKYPQVSEPAWDDDEISRLAVWLKGLPKPIGIMGCNALRSLQLVNASREAELQIPDEVAVLSANNELMRCELSYPPLSSVPTNTDLIAQLAVSRLTELMEGKQVEEELTLIDPLPVATRRSTDFLSVSDGHVVSALSCIRDEACEGITVLEVAKRANVSRSLLERKFKKYVGNSVYDEIRKIQLRKIKQLLCETDYTLFRIAELAGFEHADYMSVFFKRMTRMTPKKFRDQHRIMK